MPFDETEKTASSNERFPFFEQYLRNLGPAKPKMVNQTEVTPESERVPAAKSEPTERTGCWRCGASRSSNSGRLSNKPTCSKCYEEIKGIFPDTLDLKQRIALSVDKLIERLSGKE